MNEDKIQGFRQPMVTATGIILGFILNFAASFVKTGSTSDFLDYTILIFVLLGIVSLILVLHRILRFDYPRENCDSYYKFTLRLFIWGISAAFLGVMLDMVSHFMS